MRLLHSHIVKYQCAVIAQGVRQFYEIIQHYQLEISSVIFYNKTMVITTIKFLEDHYEKDEAKYV